MAPAIILGLDGGGTKTACVALDARTPPPNDLTMLQPLARSEQGSTNWNSVGRETAHTNFRRAIQAVLQAVHASPADVVAVGIGMSGVDRPADHTQVEEWLQGMLPASLHIIDNDAVIALAAGTGGRRFGIVLISGTGMIALGFNHAGARLRAGGWGALLGDGGSGYALGAAVLRACTWAADGRGPETSLLPSVLSHLNLTRPEELVPWAYTDIAWHRFAALAPLAGQCAAQGDAVAQNILDQAAADLAVAVETVATGLQMQNTAFPLVTAGNNLRPGRLQEALLARLAHTLPLAEPRRLAVEPAVGAALLAHQAHRGATG